MSKPLARAEQKVAHGNNNIVCSGPLYESMKVAGNKILVSFKHTGSGLWVKGGGALKSFASAGPDKKSVWANAKIQGNQVVVWGEHVEHPVAVQYAWADNPEHANLYNQEGLPASPFRTDHWDSTSY